MKRFIDFLQFALMCFDSLNLLLKLRSKRVFSFARVHDKLSLIALSEQFKPVLVEDALRNLASTCQACKRLASPATCEHLQTFSRVLYSSRNINCRYLKQEYRVKYHHYNCSDYIINGKNFV